MLLAGESKRSEIIFRVVCDAIAFVWWISASAFRSALDRWQHLHGASPCVLRRSGWSEGLHRRSGPSEFLRGPGKHHERAILGPRFSAGPREPERQGMKRCVSWSHEFLA